MRGGYKRTKFGTQNTHFGALIFLHTRLFEVKFCRMLENLLMFNRKNNQIFFIFLLFLKFTVDASEFVLEIRVALSTSFLFLVISLGDFAFLSRPAVGSFRFILSVLIRK